MDGEKHSPTISKESDILLEMEVRAAESPNDKNQRPLSDNERGIHYVLVYHRCQETENKNEDTKEKALQRQNQREKFETEIEGEGLELRRKSVELPVVEGVSFTTFCVISQ